ncbi:MAG: DUF2190 family protein [Rudaea sp.]
MKNFVQPGVKMPFIGSGDVVSGAGVVISTLLGVASHDVASGASGTAAIEGVFTLPKLSTAVIGQGDRLTWDIDSSPPQFIVASAATGDLANCAVAFAAAGNGATTVQAKLTPGCGSVT